MNSITININKKEENIDLPAFPFMFTYADRLFMTIYDYEQEEYKVIRMNNGYTQAHLQGTDMKSLIDSINNEFEKNWKLVNVNINADII
jgi:hypothetical protein